MASVITQRAGMNTEELLSTQEEHPYCSSTLHLSVGLVRTY